MFSSPDFLRWIEWRSEGSFRAGRMCAHVMRMKRMNLELGARVVRHSATSLGAKEGSRLKHKASSASPSEWRLLIYGAALNQKSGPTIYPALLFSLAFFCSSLRAFSRTGREGTEVARCLVARFFPGR